MDEAKKSKIVKVIVVVIVLILSILSIVYSYYISNKQASKVQINTKNPVSQVIDDKIGNEIVKEDEKVEVEFIPENEIQTQENIDNTMVDIDLTGLTPNIMLAEFTNISYFPNEYEGKTVKVKATYYSEYVEMFAETVQAIFMMDDTFCCQAMIEVKIQEGLTIPENNDEVMVIGRIAKYTYENQVYYRLNVYNLIVV